MGEADAAPVDAAPVDAAPVDTVLVDTVWPGGSIIERTLVAMVEAYRRHPRTLRAPRTLPTPRAGFAVPTADDLAELAPGPELAAILDALDPRRPDGAGVGDVGVCGVGGAGVATTGVATTGVDRTGVDRTGVDRTGVDTDTLVEGIAAWDRLISWATARQAALMTELDVREHRAGRGEFVVDAVSTRLGTTRRAAGVKTGLADGLALFPQVARALEGGRLDPAKARVLVDEVAAAPASMSDALLETFLPDAARLTCPQLRTRVRRAAQSVDPALAERRATAEAERRAVRLTPAPDAMAYLTAYLPAVDAATCLAALDALADAAVAPGYDRSGDERTADARRADALTDTLRTVLEGGVDLAGAPLPTRQRRRPHIQVTVAATTLLGLDDRPADLAGYGPIPAAMARAVAQDGTWRALLVDGAGQVTGRGGVSYRPGADLTGTVLARDTTCRFPGCGVPAQRCDLDHVTPFTLARPASEQTVPDNLQALCRHHHRLKTHGGWTVNRDAEKGSTAWTTPWDRTYVRDPDPPPGPHVAGPPDPGPPPF